jgi:SpoIIAA-like
VTATDLCVAAPYDLTLTITAAVEAPMFETIDGFGDDVVALRGTGTLTAEDYRTVLAPAIERSTAGGRKAKLLLELGEGFEGYDPGAILADATVGGGHMGSFERIAVVTDAEWIRRAMQLFGGLIPGDVRLFSVADGNSARDWIAARD